jgi:hypothetical protein
MSPPADSASARLRKFESLLTRRSIAIPLLINKASIGIAESLIERPTRKARKQDTAFGALEVPTRKRPVTTPRYTSVQKPSTKG